MSKLIVLIATIFTLLIASPVLAIDNWYTADQRTLEWDPVTQLTDGSPIPSGDLITYEVFTVLDGQDKSEAVSVGVVDTVFIVLTFTAEGRYLPGVRTFRLPEGETVAIPSVRIAWSDNPVDCKDGVTFGIRFFLPPLNVGGLH